MEPQLQRAVKNLCLAIEEYESDTFSASAEGISRKEAELAAAALIEHFLFDSNLCPRNCIDGEVIRWALRARTELKGRSQFAK